MCTLLFAMLDIDCYKASSTAHDEEALTYNVKNRRLLKAVVAEFQLTASAIHTTL
jgi:hypothetical protein